MTELSPRARRVIDLARHEDDPEASTRNRVEQSLTTRMALGAGVATAGTALAKTATGASVMWTVLKAVAIAGTAAAVVGSGWLAVRSLPAAKRWHTEIETRPISAARPMTPDVQSPIPVPSAVPDPQTAPSGPQGTMAVLKVATGHGAPTNLLPPAIDSSGTSLGGRPSAALDQLRAETDSLRGAQQALRAGDPEGALRLIEEQDVRYRGGLLAEERAAARVLALCQSGRSEEARAEAGRFQRRWPRSSLRARVLSSCSGR